MQVHGKPRICSAHASILQLCCDGRHVHGRTSDCEECWREIDVADDSVEVEPLRDAWSAHKKWHSRIELICDTCHRVSGDAATATPDYCVQCAGAR